MEVLAQFAVAGKLEAWFLNIETNKLLDHQLIEPLSEKTAVLEFRKGVSLTGVLGMEEDALDAYNKAIEKFEKHAYAYERRGYVCFKLRRMDDAMLDFTKSLNLYQNADAYFGRANVKMAKNDLTGAISDLEEAIKLSIPLQPVFWLARRVKGECHLKQGDCIKAVAELKFVTKREFKPEDPNYAYRHRAWHYLGEALLKCGDTAESLKAFNQAAVLEGAIKDMQRSENPIVEEPKINLKRVVAVV